MSCFLLSPLPCRFIRSRPSFYHSYLKKSKQSCNFSSAAKQHHKPVVPHEISAPRSVPYHIPAPPYAETGQVPIIFYDSVKIHSPTSISKMREAGRLARRTLDYACALAKPGVTTDAIDVLVHDSIVSQNAYPSPLNYAGFPKSLCSSVNEVICHGIPDMRPLEYGDLVSFDVSVFFNGVHGDNCATVIVGDNSKNKEEEIEKNDYSMKTERRLLKAAQESLTAAIKTCRPGSCLTEVGEAIESIAEKYNYSTIRKYRGHGISDVFHSAPYVKHYRNTDALTLQPGMIFTIEPMIVEGDWECYEWASDNWTVVTSDGGRSAQFEHTVLITEDGVEILTLP